LAFLPAFLLPGSLSEPEVGPDGAAGTGHVDAVSPASERVIKYDSSSKSLCTQVLGRQVKENANSSVWLLNPFNTFFPSSLI
jgi:hypothetical protein